LCCSNKSSSNKTIEQIKTEVRNFDNSKPILLTGGEPTLHRDFSSVICYINELNYEVHLLTNARVFNYPKYVDVIKNSKVSNVIVKLYSSSSELHDSITRSKASFNQSISAIKILLLNNIKVSILTTILNQNLHDLNCIIKKGVTLGIREFYFDTIKPKGECLLNFSKLALDYSEIMFDHFDLHTKDHSEFMYSRLKTESGNERANIFFLDLPGCYLSPEFSSLGNQFVFIGNELELRSKASRCKLCNRSQNCHGFFNQYLELFNPR
jgi:MoaA/NifB/PqqE/SkfB family radical SAM enzyme